MIEIYFTAQLYGAGQWSNRFSHFSVCDSAIILATPAPGDVDDNLAPRALERFNIVRPPVSVVELELMASIEKVMRRVVQHVLRAEAFETERVVFAFKTLIRNAIYSLQTSKSAWCWGRGEDGLRKGKE